MKRIIDCIVFLIILSVPMLGQVDAGRAGKRVAEYLNRLEAVGFNGTVLVAIGGRTVVASGYGVRDLETGVKNTPDTVFGTGSITKQFTAAAILKLETEGKLSTDDLITKYFDGVPEGLAATTIHDLLRHSSGLPNVVGKDYEAVTDAEFLEKVYAAKLRFAPGERFGYSNPGYSLLAMIVETVSGKTYEAYLYENLLKPAGMESTGYTRPRFAADVIAVGYRHDGTRWGRPTDHAWGADAPFWHLKGNGGVLSTVEDLLKWDAALRGAKVLSAEAIEKLHNPKRRKGEDENPYYAYGWDMFKTPRGTMIARHNGTNGIFFADMHRYLDENVVIIHLTNKRHPALGSINNEIGRLIFEPKYQPLIPTAETAANREFTTSLINLTIEKGHATALAAYKKRAKGVDLIERFVNDKGFELMNGGEKVASVELLKLSTSVFPRSWWAWEGLGEAYDKADEKALAIKSFERSLELNTDNGFARRSVARLKGGK